MKQNTAPRGRRVGRSSLVVVGVVVRDGGGGGRVMVVVAAAERVVQPAVVDEALEAAEVGDAVVAVVPGGRGRGHRAGGGRRQMPQHVHATGGGQSSRPSERAARERASSTSCDHFIRDLSRRIFSRSP